MKRTSVWPIAMLMLSTFGCGEIGEKEISIPLDEVPANIRKIAAEKLPGVKFETAYKETKNGKQVYEVRGKTKEGKIQDLEITSDGEVLEN